MRLLQAMAGARHGGAEAFFERFATALQRAGTEQLVVVRHEERAARLAAAGVPVRTLRFGGALDLATRWRFGAILRAWQPDVVLTWMSRATSACPRGRFVHVARLGGYYDLRRYRACDHLVGNTRDIVAWMARQGWPAERAHYLPNFVTVPAAARLERPEGVPLALALGRLHRNKAFDVLIDAALAFPELHLWIAGEGPERAALEARAAPLGERVRFLGWRDDTAALLATADMLVCPSRHEPLGNVVIEAWAAGRPVVAAASVGPAALVRDGETGLLVPVDDAAALAAALRRLAEDTALAGRLAEAGRRAYEAEFTEEAVVARWRAFLEGVAR
ncbi:MAG: glycosyltransferase [Rhodospirillales bacterium]|nr:glycosyltransferase [Rhodospirillales bacterium]